MFFKINGAVTFSAPESGQAAPTRRTHAPGITWHCREPWFGDSRDGQLVNGEGYHYFQMKGDGVIEKAVEWYESDDGEEHATEIPELVGLNWYEFFGYEDDEILETVPPHEFSYIETLVQSSKK
jgi:hypothetical protein